ncbi:MAG: response regulator [Proteobacteria bacterium]|nr:response regulator [Pseudomonadota bacterium]
MQNKLIILVEDNEDDAELAVRALQRNKIAAKVKVFSDGEVALEYLLSVGQDADMQGEAMPQLVLLDLKLPRLNGIEVLDRLRTRLQTRLPPVVMLTTSNAEIDIAECYRLGANSYIQKPVDFSQFIAAVGEIANYWLGLNETVTGQHDSL